MTTTDSPQRPDVESPRSALIEAVRLTGMATHLVVFATVWCAFVAGLAVLLILSPKDDQDRTFVVLSLTGFGLVGVVLLGVSVWLRRGTRKPAPTMHPGAGSVIEAESRIFGAIAWSSAAVIFCGIVVVCLLSIPWGGWEGEAGLKFLIVLTPFGLAGLFLLYMGVAETWAAMTIPPMTLSLAEVPVIVGGRLRAEIQSPRSVAGQHSAVTMTCWEGFEDPVMVWQGRDDLAELGPGVPRSSWLFDIEIPFDARENHLPASPGIQYPGDNRFVSWVVKLVIDGCDMATFKVQVFRTSKSSSEINGARSRPSRVSR